MPNYRVHRRFIGLAGFTDISLNVLICIIGLDVLVSTRYSYYTQMCFG